MKANTLIRLLPAALLALGSTTFTACSDDEHEASGPGIADVEIIDDTYATACNVYGMLAEESELPANWASQQYKPTVGHVLNEATPYVRSYVTFDLSDARTFFAALTSQLEADVSDDATWSDPALGTLSFHAVGQPDCIATIDVDLKQMPELTQIRFVPLASLGINAGSKPEPYYSFGDIVKRDKDGTMWFCIRPANEALGKKKSYWASFDFHGREDEFRTIVYEDPKDETSKRITVLKNLGSHFDQVKNVNRTLMALFKPDELFQHFHKSADHAKGFCGLPLPDDKVEAQLYRSAAAWQVRGLGELLFPNLFQNHDFKNLSEIEKMDTHPFQFFFESPFTIFYGKSNKVKLGDGTFGYTGQSLYCNIPDRGKEYTESCYYDGIQQDFLLKPESDHKERTDLSKYFWGMGFGLDQAISWESALIILFKHYKRTFESFNYGWLSPDYTKQWTFTDLGAVVRIKTGYELSKQKVGNPATDKKLPGVTDVYVYKNENPAQ